MRGFPMVIGFPVIHMPYPMIELVATIGILPAYRYPYRLFNGEPGLLPI